MAVTKAIFVLFFAFAFIQIVSCSGSSDDDDDDDEEEEESSDTETESEEDTPPPPKKKAEAKEKTKGKEKAEPEPAPAKAKKDEAKEKKKEKEQPQDEAPAKPSGEPKKTDNTGKENPIFSLPFDTMEKNAKYAVVAFVEYLRTVVNAMDHAEFWLVDVYWFLSADLDKKAATDKDNKKVSDILRTTLKESLLTFLGVNYNIEEGSETTDTKKKNTKTHTLSKGDLAKADVEDKGTDTKSKLLVRKILAEGFAADDQVAVTCTLDANVFPVGMEKFMISDEDGDPSGSSKPTRKAKLNALFTCRNNDGRLKYLFQVLVSEARLVARSPEEDEEDSKKKEKDGPYGEAGGLVSFKTHIRKHRVGIAENDRLMVHLVVPEDYGFEFIKTKAGSS